jgi:uncharacterized protein (TIGR03437 family)
MRQMFLVFAEFERYQHAHLRQWAGLVLLLLLSAHAGSAQDDFGNTCASSTAVAFPGTASGVLEVGGDVDIFRINVTQPGTLTATASSPFDTVGSLFDAFCNLIVDDDDSGGGLNFQLTRTLNSGIYYLAMTGYGSSDIGSYTITMSFSAGPPLPDDHGNICTSATAVAFPGTASGVLEVGGDIDVFRINVTQSGTVTATANSLFDSVGGLFDGSCNLIVADHDSGSGLNFQLAQSLNSGTYYLAIGGYESSGIGGYTITTSLTGASPAVSDGATVNGATFALHPAPLAPGAIATIFGANLTTGSVALSTSFGLNGQLVTSLVGTEVRVNQVLAPMFFATPSQLAFQIPMEVAGDTMATVQVTAAGQSSIPRTIFLDAVSPGIFTVNQNGAGRGMFTHADGFLVSEQHPARPGEAIVMYATGLGLLDPPLATGAPSLGNQTAIPATVIVDGVPADVLFSGSTPGFVGLNQVNFRIPPSTRSSATIPVVLSIGGKLSNSVTISVSP